MSRLLLTLSLLLTIALPARAEQFEQIGDYQIHYNTFTTGFLQPDVARAYKIVRSRYQAMINISVLKKQADDSYKPVEALVTGDVSNLAGQSTNLGFRTIREKDGIYQITTFNFTEDEPTRFRLKVRFDPNIPAHDLSFIRRFYGE
ncbi:DUF4426 domain-containing protein [Oceanospirillum sediminis]|uniref:DUF4426 domain-containing protein n=1 Tax=Oceanospirillum sediminis TaxID=2760088 RepID=A0A839IP35_9GAMM|nr:DUF4426 domain-containing protein [Oceanospirillum sediminis]MBB1486444.1 DUF4426 domain-containing protein [Oceanospirillum sediminis]